MSQATWFLSLALAAFALSPALAQPDPDLIGHWPLDDGTGLVATDAASANNGTLIGGPNWEPAGRIDGALDFDGLDDLVDLGLPDYETPPGNLTDQMTLAFWIRAEAFGIADARLVSRADGTAEQDHLWMVSTFNGTALRFRLKTDGTTTALVSDPGLLQIGVWHHVAAVYDGAEMHLYLDGVEVAVAAKTGLIDTSSSVGAALGNQPPGAGDKSFDGLMDDVRLYRRALAQIEIGQLAFPDGNEPPRASFTRNPPVGEPPLLVAFDASASYDVDGTIVDYIWSFSDGGTGNGIQTSHTFMDLGSYPVYLVVVDNEGAVGVDSMTILITENPLTEIPFTHEVIDATPPAYTHCKAAGDIDGDGLKDVMTAGAKDGDGFFWYRNPTWEKFTIVPPGVTGFSTDMAMDDMDGDGDLDAIIPKGFDYGDSTFWYENPRPTGDPETAPWTEHFIGAAGAHDVETGDIDGNGLTDVMVRWQETTLYLQTAPDTWAATTISTRDDEGLDLADIDGDDDLDALINGHWLENPLPGMDPGLDSWNEHVIDTDWPDATRVLAVDLDDDGQPEVVFAGSETVGERIAWYGTVDPLTGPWIEHEIDTSADYVHSLEAGDMDLDGDIDIVMAEMHQSDDPDQVTIYRNEGDNLLWWPQMVATTGSHNMVVTDMDNDGDLDMVGANHAQPPLEMWRNEMNPHSLLGLSQWERHVPEPAMPWQAIFLEPAQIDDDGLTDLVAGGWWYKNPGFASGTWVRSDLGLPLRNMAAVHDFDDDGFLDVVGTEGTSYLANSDFVWARNDGLGGFTIYQNITPAVGEFLQGAAVSTLAPAGPLELVLSWQNGSDTQMLTVPADPMVDIWPWRIASDSSLGEGLAIGDIDRDGDLDINQGIQWLRNEGGDVWTTFAIFPPTPPGQPDRVFLVDMNLDGRLDSVVSYGHDRPYGSLAWYEQPAVATDMWIEHVIDNPYNPQSLDIADMDKDGDVDLVMGEHNKPDPELSELAIYENIDGFSGAWRQRVIYTGDEHHVGARLLDIEPDGDLDIASIGFTHKRMMIYENLSSPGRLSPVPDPDTAVLPSRLVLSPNYPNPFNPSTRIRYELPTASKVSLEIYDVRGRLVTRLVDQEQTAGSHEVTWTARGVASGVYLAHLKAGGQVRTTRMLLLK